jgi:hypothetical protein
MHIPACMLKLAERPGTVNVHSHMDEYLFPAVHAAATKAMNTYPAGMKNQERPHRIAHCTGIKLATPAVNYRLFEEDFLALLPEARPGARPEADHLTQPLGSMWRSMPN